MIKINRPEENVQTKTKMTQATKLWSKLLQGLHGKSYATVLSMWWCGEKESTSGPELGGKIRSSKSSTCTGGLRKLSPQTGTARTSQVIHCAAFLKMKNQPLWTDKQEKTNLNRTKAVLAAASQNDGGQKTTGSTSNHWRRKWQYGTWQLQNNPT